MKGTNSKEETKSRVFIDRDINGSKNILKIAKYWLEHKKRPNAFSRSQQKTNIKDAPAVSATKRVAG